MARGNIFRLRSICGSDLWTAYSREKETKNLALTRTSGGWGMRYVAVLLIALASVGLNAFAQEADLRDEIDEEPDVQQFDRTFDEEITITGSLIPRPTLESLSPVAVLDVTEELTYSGATRIEDLIISLPQIFAAQSSRFANGADGTATVSLRYLGPHRTLVLINGRRLASGSLFGADLNIVPPSLVKRVDVLTGGASTVYGTDAVAGVVNFVLDTDFTGVRGNFQYSFFQHDNRNELAQDINEAAGYEVPTGNAVDGGAIRGHIAVGGRFADGKGHGAAYVEYRNIEEVNLAQRDYSNCAVNRGAEGPYCGGSATSGQGTFYSFNSLGGFHGVYTLHTAEEGGDGHSLRPWRGEMYNFNPFNPYQRPDEKWNAGGFAHYTVNEHLEPYIEAMFMYDVTDAIIAPSGNWSYNRLNCDNPMLSDQQRILLCESAGFEPTDYATVYMLRRNVEGGPRTNYLDHSNLRIVAGVRGDLGENWGYDFYGLHAQNKKTDIYEKDLHVERMANALDVIVDPETGEWACRAEDPGCVPWNIFREGGVTEEALDYMYADLIALTDSQTQVVNLTFTGDLEGYGIRLPSASEGLGVAVGAEYRGEDLHIQPDENYQQGVGAGQGGGYPPVDGHYDVSELFIEAAVPLIQNTGGFEDLSMELGYRYSDYSTSGGYNTYKALLNWAITDSWRLRGGYNRAVRAANVYELFEPQELGLGLNQDICANDPATGEPLATLEECMRTGVTEEQYGNILPHPSEQYNTLFGGNPFLVPETADTWTAGVVWTPQRIPGFR